MDLDAKRTGVDANVFSLLNVTINTATVFCPDPSHRNRTMTLVASPGRVIAGEAGGPICPSTGRQDREMARAVEGRS